MKAAVFVTAHGMGHGSRASALMQALQALEPGSSFEVFSSLPAWVFEHSLDLSYRLHPMQTDIGLVQRTPFEADLPETVRQLAALLPYSDAIVSQAAEITAETGCKVVLCDIAPLGVLVAEHLGIPSVLVENFRWGWIYADYLEAAPELGYYSAYLEEIFGRASLHIQTEPLCEPDPRARLVVPPISRIARTPPEIIRARIGAPQGMKVVLVTSGTPSDTAAFAAQESAAPGLFFVFPDDVPDLAPTPNGVQVPRRCYHPDLVNASDAVVGKAGYSTIAEVYQAGALFAYISRPDFRESPVLAEFIQKEMGGFEIPADWQDLSWLPALSERLESYTPGSQAENGAFSAARSILSAFS